MDADPFPSIYDNTAHYLTQCLCVSCCVCSLADDPLFLQRIITDMLLENKHRATVHSRPDPSMSSTLIAAENAAL